MGDGSIFLISKIRMTVKNPRAIEVGWDVHACVIARQKSLGWLTLTTGHHETSYDDETRFFAKLCDKSWG